MKIKVEMMTLNQFRGVMNNADKLIERLIVTSNGMIPKELLVRHTRKYLYDNGIHAETDEVNDFVYEHVTDKLSCMIDTVVNDLLDTETLAEMIEELEISDLNGGDL